ncbi:CAP domain-containing protein [Streptococcus ovis]|uniref:CAP domain-containing protein n=1 Tax=Streptococcus ovis TaxID=82806 RepID=UPI000369E3C5|nr:CAP domain-containing protein [Streptococcus ovis]
MKQRLIRNSFAALTVAAALFLGGQAKADTGLYRLYHSGLKVHLFTKDTNEYKVLDQRGWTQEGLAWNTADDKGEIVYRLYHPGLRVHLYTKDTNEYKVLGQRGWRQEGPAYRSYGELPIYRLYHQGMKKHLYTRDAYEYKVLGTRGWRQEGIAFYGLTEPSKTVPPVAKPTTKVATKATIKPVTQKTKTTTKVASKPVTQATTKPTTKAVTKATTKATTKPSTKPSTKATTATTKPTTSVTTKATTARPTTTTPTTTTVTTTTTKPTTADNSAYLIATVPKIMSQMLDAYRAEMGEKPMKYDAKNLQALADLRARQIQEEYAHTYKGKSVADIAYETIEDEDLALMIGATGISENIAMFSARDMTSDDVAHQMMTMWKESHGHNMNLLNSRSTNYAFAISKVGNTYYGVYLAFSENFHV